MGEVFDIAKGLWPHIPFRVACSLIFSAILFKIVKLIFPHKLRLCNVICVAYRVAYRVVVLLHIACNVKTRYDYHVFEIKTRFANLENAMKRYPTRIHDCMWHSTAPVQIKETCKILIMGIFVAMDTC